MSKSNILKNQCKSILINHEMENMNEIKNEISKIFLDEYNENFYMILILKEEDFFSYISNRVELILFDSFKISFVERYQHFKLILDNIQNEKKSEYLTELEFLEEQLISFFVKNSKSKFNESKFYNDYIKKKINNFDSKIVNQDYFYTDNAFSYEILIEIFDNLKSKDDFDRNFFFQKHCNFNEETKLHPCYEYYSNIFNKLKDLDDSLKYVDLHKINFFLPVFDDDYNNYLNKNSFNKSINQKKKRNSSSMTSLFSYPIFSNLRNSYNNLPLRNFNNLENISEKSDKEIKINESIVNKNIKYLICLLCRMVHRKESIFMNCDFCSLPYFTYIKENLEESIFPATWEKYHCRAIVNEQMICKDCQSNLFLNTNSNKLFCKDCNFISNPKDIMWDCMICNQKFNSNAKIYNPLEYKIIKQTIKDAMLKKIPIYPEQINCCEKLKYKIIHKHYNNDNFSFHNLNDYKIKEIFFFKHSEKCKGNLYEGFYYRKKVVVCSECKTIGNYEKFIWECVFCKKKYKNKKNENNCYMKEKIETKNSIANQNPFQSNEININPKIEKTNLTYNKEYLQKNKRHSNEDNNVELKNNYYSHEEKKNYIKQNGNKKVIKISQENKTELNDSFEREDKSIKEKEIPFNVNSFLSKVIKHKKNSILNNMKKIDSNKEFSITNRNKKISEVKYNSFRLSNRDDNKQMNLKSNEINFENLKQSLLNISSDNNNKFNKINKYKNEETKQINNILNMKNLDCKVFQKMTSFDYEEISCSRIDQKNLEITDINKTTHSNDNYNSNEKFSFNSNKDTPLDEENDYELINFNSKFKKYHSEFSIPQNKNINFRKSYSKNIDLNLKTNILKSFENESNFSSCSKELINNENEKNLKNNISFHSRNSLFLNKIDKQNKNNFFDCTVNNKKHNVSNEIDNYLTRFPLEKKYQNEEKNNLEQDFNVINNLNEGVPHKENLYIKPNFTIDLNSKNNFSNRLIIKNLQNEDCKAEEKNEDSLNIDSINNKMERMIELKNSPRNYKLSTNNSDQILKNSIELNSKKNEKNFLSTSNNLNELSTCSISINNRFINSNYSKKKSDTEINSIINLNSFNKLNQNTFNEKKDLQNDNYKISNILTNQSIIFSDMNEDLLRTNSYEKLDQESKKLLKFNSNYYFTSNRKDLKNKDFSNNCKEKNNLDLYSYLDSNENITLEDSKILKTEIKKNKICTPIKIDSICEQEFFNNSTNNNLYNPDGNLNKEELVIISEHIDDYKFELDYSNNADFKNYKLNKKIKNSVLDNNNLNIDSIIEENIKISNNNKEKDQIEIIFREDILNKNNNDKKTSYQEIENFNTLKSEDNKINVRSSILSQFENKSNDLNQRKSLITNKSNNQYQVFINKNNLLEEKFEDSIKNSNNNENTDNEDNNSFDNKYRSGNFIQENKEVKDIILLNKTPVKNNLENEIMNYESPLINKKIYFEDIIDTKTIESSKPSIVNFSINENIFDQNKFKILIEDFTFHLDDYIMDKIIGEGTFANVYSAHNKINNKKVAIKKIIIDEIKQLNSLASEIKILNEFNHENIIKTYGISFKKLDETTYALYILMELANMDWETHIKYNQNNKILYSEIELLNILKQIVSCLSFLQKNNISHRDIKPHNLLIFNNKTDNSKFSCKNNLFIKVSDFGEARIAFENKTRKLYTIKGTELFMSPKLISCYQNIENEVNHNPFKSDCFSLGLCLLYAATLNINSVHDIRFEIQESNKISNTLNKYLKLKFTKKFLDLLTRMLEIDEEKRPDFMQLNDFLRKF